MTPTLVKNMTDSDLLDMHYFLIEDDDLDDDEFEEGFYIDLFNHRLFSYARLWRVFFTRWPDRAISYINKKNPAWDLPRRGRFRTTQYLPAAVRSLAEHFIQ